jgi:hypothetical protein
LLGDIERPQQFTSSKSGEERSYVEHQNTRIDAAAQKYSSGPMFDNENDWLSGDSYLARCLLRMSRVGG